MPRKRNIFNESKDHFVNRKRNSGVRKTMHEDPLLGAKRNESIGEYGISSWKDHRNLLFIFAFLTYSSVYEFMVGNGVWDVFGTKEWELFTVDFNRLCCCIKDWKNKPGLTISDKGVGQDGRVRYQVLLPDLTWTKMHVSRVRFPHFPIRAIKNEHHVPLYLDFCASLVVDQQGDRLLDLIRSDENRNFGSAKLVTYKKDKKLFTVIVYGTIIPR